MESAIRILRQACEYLHEGNGQSWVPYDRPEVRHRKGTTGHGRADAERFMQLQTRRIQGSQLADTIASRVDEMSGEVANIRDRLEGLERRVGMEGQQHDAVLREPQAVAMSVTPLILAYYAAMPTSTRRTLSQGSRGFRAEGTDLGALRGNGRIPRGYQEGLSNARKGLD